MQPGLKNWTAFLFLASLLLWNGCERTEPAYSEYDLPEKIDFNIHVKPILSDRCFSCHGPDPQALKAGLALHERESAFAELPEDPGHYAIVPGKPFKSRLYQRITSPDPARVMPPPESNLQLSGREIALLKKWIEEGAEYQPHWSFIPLKKTALPKVKNRKWGQNGIDRFVLARLGTEGLSPSPPASGEQLIRRLSFDLRGLPPTPEEIDAFLADEAPDAYEKLADRFLADPAYGERMAAHWLDVARYADSDGYLDDKHRDFSPWRDWVIDAFNRNLSYRDFITWQLAGDLLPDRTLEQVLATAFNRLHKKNSEAGIIFEEYRVEYVADRTNTLGKAVMALSLECARCHDHKYDPISQEEYFQLFAFFNSTDEIGHAVYGPDQTPGPALLLTDEEIERQLAFVDRTIRERETRLAREVSAGNQAFKRWMEEEGLSLVEIRKELIQKQSAHFSFDRIVKREGEAVFCLEDQDRTPEARLVNPVIRPGAEGNAFFAGDFSSGRLPKDVGLFERTEPFSIDLWIYPDTVYEEAGVFLHCENLRLGYKGYSLHLRDNRLSFIIAHSWPQNALQLTTGRQLPVREWTRVTITYDGSSRASGVRIYWNGTKTPLTTERDNLYKGIVFEWNIHTYGFSGFTFGQRDKVKLFRNGGLDEIRIFSGELTPLEVLCLHDPGAAEAALSGPERAAWSEPFYFAHIHKGSRVMRDSLQADRRRANELYNQVPEIMVMGDLPEPRPTFVLNRGNYDSPVREVFPATPERILPFPEKLPKNRLGLAEWLFDPRHPLTARVFVNRVWQLHFGRGIVKTSEDFGNQGDLPSHPELLDWLALRFIESGWDVKALHKLIVMSATYRQSSVADPSLLAIDPENELLARGSSYRLPAEMIRDNALMISGLIADRVGGESVYPYQPEGLWDEISNKVWRYPYLQQPGEGLYRRSIYTIWKRTAPPPAMQIFDIADRDVCTVRRRPTNTPLQALVLLNDPQFQEASRMTAQRVIREVGDDPEKQVVRVFRLVFGRGPDIAEMALAKGFYDRELERFRSSPEDALAYLSVGEMEWDRSLPPEDIAALGVVVNSLLNTYEGTRK